MPPKRKKSIRHRDILATFLASASVSRASPMALVIAAVLIVISAGSMAYIFVLGGIQVEIV